MARTVKPFNLFFNLKGIDQNTGPMSIQPNVASIITNMNVDLIGQWSTFNQGFSNFSTALGAPSRVDGMYWFADQTGTDHLLAASNGNLYALNVSNGATLSTPFTGLTGSNPLTFETFLGSMFLASSTINPYLWTGTGPMTASGGWPIVNGSQTYANPKIVCKYSNRLAYANMSGSSPFPSHIAISDYTSPQTFTIGTTLDTNGAIIQVAPGDGQTITAMHNYSIPNSNEETLLIFKERSIYTMTGDTQSAFQLNLLNNNFGALGQNAVVQVGSDVIFMDINNIYSLTTATTNGTLQPRAISSQQVIDTLGTLNISAKSKVWTIHHPQRKEVWFAIPTGSNTECDTIIVYRYDTDSQGNSLQAWSIRTGTYQTCATFLEKAFYTGDNLGYVNAWFNSTSYNGIGVPWEYQYPFYNFGTQNQNKRVLECYLWFLLYDTEEITISTQWRNGGNNTQRTVNVSASITDGLGSIYGTTAPPAAIYGTSIYGGGSLLRKVKIPVYGNGEQLQFDISGTTGTTGPIFLGISGLVEFMGYSRTYK